MATMEQQRDTCLEAAAHEAEKVVALRKRCADLLELLEQAVSMAELRLAPHLADRGVSGITDYWLEPAKDLIAGIKAPTPVSQEGKLDQMLAEFGAIAHQKLNTALASGNVPESWLQDEDNHLAQKAVLDSACRDRPFRPLSPDHKAVFDNLHLTI